MWREPRPVRRCKSLQFNWLSIGIGDVLYNCADCHKTMTHAHLPQMWDRISTGFSTKRWKSGPEPPHPKPVAESPNLHISHSAVRTSLCTSAPRDAKSKTRASLHNSPRKRRKRDVCQGRENLGTQGPLSHVTSPTLARLKAFWAFQRLHIRV